MKNNVFLAASALIAVMALTGCESEENSTWFKNTPQNEIQAFYVQRCSSYGYRQNTISMSDCVANEIRAAQQRNATIQAGRMTVILAH